jgi:hypothetical protein
VLGRYGLDCSLSFLAFAQIDEVLVARGQKFACVIGYHRLILSSPENHAMQDVYGTSLQFETHFDRTALSQPFSLFCHPWFVARPARASSGGKRMLKEASTVPTAILIGIGFIVVVATEMNNGDRVLNNFSRTGMLCCCICNLAPVAS